MNLFIMIFLSTFTICAQSFAALPKKWNFTVSTGKVKKGFELIVDKNSFKLKIESQPELITVSTKNAKYLLEQVAKWPMATSVNPCPQNNIAVQITQDKKITQQIACLEGPKNQKKIEIESARRAAEALFFLSHSK
jgi:hypothetical protein